MRYTGLAHVNNPRFGCLAGDRGGDFLRCYPFSAPCRSSSIARTKTGRCRSRPAISVYPFKARRRRRRRDAVRPKIIKQPVKVDQQTPPCRDCGNLAAFGKSAQLPLRDAGLAALCENLLYLRNRAHSRHAAHRRASSFCACMLRMK